MKAGDEDQQVRAASEELTATASDYTSPMLFLRLLPLVYSWLSKHPPRAGSSYSSPPS